MDPLEHHPGGWAPSPAPDGRAVAYISDAGGRPQLWIGAPKSQLARVVDTGAHPVQEVHWSPDGAWLALVLAPAGSCRTQVWLVRPDGSDLHRVGGGGTGMAAFGRWSRDGRTLVLAQAADDTTLVVLLDADSGFRRTMTVPGLVAVMDVDEECRRLLLRHGPRGQRELLVADVSTGAVIPLLGHSTDANTDLGRFSRDGRTAYVRTDLFTDLPALVAVPVPTGPRTRDDDPGGARVLAARRYGELEAFDVPLRGSRLALLWNASGCSELTLLDVGTGEERPGPVIPGPVLSCVAYSADGERLVVAAEGPGQPSHVWVSDVDRGRFTPVPRRMLSSGPPHTAQPVLERFTADDGLPLTGWLYDARPPGAAPGPLVIWLHGGPEAQERPGFSPLHQTLVAAGISVFAVNVRGSSGFGRAFVNADNLERRFAAISDVASCVRHVVGLGVGDPARIGCMGRSYGGYLTLAALVAHPELFAAGVDVCGMADFATFYERTEPWIAAAAVSKYGDPVADADLLRELSPLHRMDRLQAPLLVVHGSEDTNVPVHEAEQAVAAAQAAGVPVRYLLFDGEGHETLQVANQMRFLAETRDWLHAHLAAARLAA